MSRAEKSDTGTMGRNWPLYLTVGIVVACLVTAFVIRTNRHHDITASQRPPARSSSSAVPTSASPTRSQASPGFVATVTTDSSPVKQALATFVADLYLIKPDDTTESRKERFAQTPHPATPDVLSRLNFVVYTTSAVDKQRIEGRQTITAQLGNKLEVTDVHGDGSTLFVVAKAEVALTDPSGNVTHRLSIRTGSTWLNQGGWTMTSYSDNYQQPGGQ